MCSGNAGPLSGGTRVSSSERVRAGERPDDRREHVDEDPQADLHAEASSKYDVEVEYGR